MTNLTRLLICLYAILGAVAGTAVVMITCAEVNAKEKITLREEMEAADVNVETTCEEARAFLKPLLAKYWLAPPQRHGSGQYYIDEDVWDMLTIFQKKDITRSVWKRHMCLHYLLSLIHI